jgi:hypothetical protein
MHKSVNLFRFCLFVGQFSSFLVEEDAQKAHVSTVFVPPRLGCETLFIEHQASLEICVEHICQILKQQDQQGIGIVWC